MWDVWILNVKHNAPDSVVLLLSCARVLSNRHLTGQSVSGTIPSSIGLLTALSRLCAHRSDEQARAAALLSTVRLTGAFLLGATLVLCRPDTCLTTRSRARFRRSSVD